MNENIVSGRSEHSLEKNPWSNLEVDFRVNKGTSSFSRVSEISSDDILVSEQDFLDKNYVVDRSRYWQRHAIMHWYPQSIPEILGFREYVYGVNCLIFKFKHSYCALIYLVHRIQKLLIT